MRVNSVTHILWATRLVYKSVQLHGADDDFNIDFYLDKLNVAVDLMKEELELSKQRKREKLLAANQSPS